MRIYLADLSHTGVGRSPNVVPLGMGYLVAYAKKHFPDIAFLIFRDPARLLAASRTESPDLVAFSVHLWSESLSAFCAQRIKEISDRTIIAAGGPCIDDIDSEIFRFMNENPHYDVCVPSEGEVSFVKLIEHVRENGGLRKGQLIEGCATMSADGTLVRGMYTMPELSEIPSPYLGGELDAFLEEGYEPIIQSMRGCPYSCRFCVSGTPLWSKFRAFDLQRVFDEFEYVKKRTQSDHLILTDENLGILGKRDVELAEYVVRSYYQGAFPRRLYFYSAKIVTEHVLRVIEILEPIGEFGMSFQTLNPAVKKEIRRTNISYDQFQECIQWAAKRKILTSTEMIFGFPGETVESYLEGLERLITSGVDRIYSFNLRLFSGIDFATKENRKKYDLKTAYRLPERTYGVYDNCFVAETEEVVVGSNSFDLLDYYKVRKYGFFLELCCGRGYLNELIKVMRKLGLPGEKLVAFFTDHPLSGFPKLAAVVGEYQNAAKAELFRTPQQCIEQASKVFMSGKPIPEVKLNYIYIGRIMFDEGVRAEFIALVKVFVSSVTDSPKAKAFFEEYLNNIFKNQIVTFKENEKTLLCTETKLDLEAVENGNYTSADDLFAGCSCAIDFELHEDSVNFLKSNHLSSASSDSALQDLYMKVSRFGLMRKRKVRAKI